MIEVVSEDIDHHAVCGFMGAQGLCTGAFEAFVSIFVGQAQQPQAGEVSLLLEDFGVQDARGYFLASRAGSTGTFQEVLSGIALDFGVMLVIGRHVFGHCGVGIGPTVALGGRRYAGARHRFRRYGACK